MNKKINSLILFLVICTYNTIDIIRFKFGFNLYAIFILFPISATNSRRRRFIAERGRDVAIEIAHAVIRDSILSAPL